MRLAFAIFKLEEEHRKLSEDHITRWEGMLSHLIGAIEQEAEVAGIDAEEGQTCPPVLADAAEHRAITTDDGDEIGGAGFVMLFFEWSGQFACFGVPAIGLKKKLRPFQRAASPGAGDGSTVKAVTLDVGKSAGMQQMLHIFTTAQTVANGGAGPFDEDFDDLRMRRKILFIELKAGALHHGEVCPLPKLRAMCPGALDGRFTACAAGDEIRADDVPQLMILLEALLKLKIPREGLSLEITEIDDDTRDAAEDDVRQRGAVNRRHAIGDRFIRSWAAGDDTHLIEMLRHHAGDLRVMMAGRVKTASEDGKAMHAPMLAAVREKRNWKFDGGGAWRELFRMKLSQLPMIAVALLLAGMVFIVFDMSQPVKTAHGSAAPGTVGAAIAQSTSAKPVMVEFYADWCGPCKVVGPKVEEFAKEVAARARVIRVNVDEDPRLGQQHGVRGIPAFIVFKNGKETARDVGAISKERMRELLAE